MKMDVGKEYVRVILERFTNVKNLGDRTINQLTDEDILWAFNEESNSIAVIVKHLSGNMISRWTDFLHSDGEKPDRNREQEFINTISSKLELIEIWEKGWSILFSALNQLSKKGLLRNVIIRGETHSVMEAIERQMAHYANILDKSFISER